VGVNDKETDLFEALWPLPRGVAYNSYLVIGQKIALIDTVKAFYLTDLVSKIKRLLGEDRPIDYLVVNHMEPDHSGSIRILKNLYPDLKIICNAQTVKMLENFYAVTEGVIQIKDGEELDLGGHVLKFFLTPMVHWPETMMTYDKPAKTLFSCDAFGGFGCLEGGIFDDEVDMSYYEGEILRYFSNIVGRYSDQVQAAISKLRGTEIRVVAPSHGPIHRSKPENIISLYDRWSRHETECGAVVVYGSMYGNTAKLAQASARAMAKEGIEHIVVHDASRDHVSFIIRDIWRYKGLILASCTYNTMPFPPIADLMAHLENKKMRNRLLGIMGNYTWSPGILKKLEDFAKNSGKWELLDPQIVIQSSPKDEGYVRAEELGKAMAERLKECAG
jgi:flavorubredoxin